MDSSENTESRKELPRSKSTGSLTLCGSYSAKDTAPPPPDSTATETTSDESTESAVEPVESPDPPDWLLLPDEITVTIFTYMRDASVYDRKRVKDFGAIMLTCSRWYNIIKDKGLWRIPKELNYKGLNRRIGWDDIRRYRYALKRAASRIMGRKRCFIFYNPKAYGRAPYHVDFPGLVVCRNLKHTHNGKQMNKKNMRYNRPWKFVYNQDSRYYNVMHFKWIPADTKSPELVNDYTHGWRGVIRFPKGNEEPEYEIIPESLQTCGTVRGSHSWRTYASGGLVAFLDEKETEHRVGATPCVYKK